MRRKIVDWVIDNFSLVFIALAFVGVITLFGYAIYYESSAPTKGVVVDKTYTKEHTETTYKTVKQGKETINVPMQKYVGSQYTITIKGLNKNEKMVKYSFEVTPEEYETIQLGDTYIRKLE